MFARFYLIVRVYCIYIWRMVLVQTGKVVFFLIKYTDGNNHSFSHNSFKIVKNIFLLVWLIYTMYWDVNKSCRWVKGLGWYRVLVLVCAIERPLAEPELGTWETITGQGIYPVTNLCQYINGLNCYSMETEINFL